MTKPRAKKVKRKLNVVDFPVPDYRKPVKMLRNLADEIEAGAFGEITSLGVVTFGSTMEVFGAGVDSGPTTVALLFHAAALRFASELEAHGRE